MNTTATNIIGLLALASARAAAESYEPSGIDFHYGDRCEKLEELSLDDIVKVIVGANDKERSAFCSVDAASACDAFERTLQEFGALIPAAKAGLCRFAPKSMIMHAPLPRNVW